jgi:hypothetical protein
MKVILEEFQRNITSCLLEISVSFSRIAEELPTTSGTNPQTLTNSHAARLRNSTVIVHFSDISSVPDTFDRRQEHPTKHKHSRKGSTVILMSSP